MRPYPQMVFREQFAYLNFTDDQCIRRLRFTKEVVTEICQLLQPQLQPQSTARTPLPVAVKVTVALNFYASGSFQAAAEDISNISQFAVHCFPMVQGAIDCMHIAMCAPHLNLGIFMNRKGFHSLDVQRIMQVNARSPGSSYDSFILRQSSVPLIFQPAMASQMLLLGDKGYPLMTWFMTPVRNPCRCAQQAYNESHSATWNIIVHTIGVLKQHFRCLDRSGGAPQCTAERV
ncbi:putative nuclease HARBI1 [Heptranchias perlo]|uniref:putative nuclease HARBI1 n=1 Tax=Heptranchias perlo TaxID=212740 RepID=UPI00355ABF22